jgi:hypothetical protein
MKERKPFLLRLDPVLYESLEQWAQQELRSVNGQIEFLLREAVNRRQRGKTSSTETTRRAPDSGDRGRPP